MFNDATPMPTIAVGDLAKAREFYEDVLGLEVQAEQPEAQLVVYTSGQGGLQLYVSSMAGSNKATYATWEVSDIDSAVEYLADKGVKFEHYPDMPEVTLEGDVHSWGNEKAAWFTDPDGNILCIHQG